MDFWDGGVFCNFGFGLREKSWKFGFLGWGEGGYSATTDLDLGKKVGNLDFWDGGDSATSDLDLGKKVGNLDFWDGGVFCNFGFGLREKSWKFGFLGKKVGFGWVGGYSATSDLDLGKKVGNLDFWEWGGSVTSDLDLGVGNLDFWDGGGILQLWIWT